jgi:dihydroxycyclohexadiene carboxylate dehydrogenase
MPSTLTNTVAIVTGASSGIGEATAKTLAEHGAAVAVVARRQDRLDALVTDIETAGGTALAVVADIGDRGQAETAVQTVIDRFGRIDILINNVGGTIWAKPYAEYSEEEIQAEIRRSLFPTLWCCRAVLPHLLEQGGGTIVNVGSVATRGVNRVPYAAAKGGVRALTAALAFEYAGRGIRVVSTAPGGTEAPERRVPRGPGAQTEEEKVWYQAIVDQTVESSFLKRYGTIEEQVAPILFLASDEASYITGVTLPVAGGDLG